MMFAINGWLPPSAWVSENAVGAVGSAKKQRDDLPLNAHHTHHRTQCIGQNWHAQQADQAVGDDDAKLARF